MELPPGAMLEDWLRDFYFTNEIDISSSGVEPYSMLELRTALGITADELDQVVFRDSHSRGGPELRSAIAEQFGDGDERRVLATNGSCEAEYLFMTTFLRPGDEVVALEPSYHTLGALPQAVGCQVVPWRLRAENGFAPDLDELKTLVSARTRALIVNFPHNPTGASVDRAGRDAIIQIVERFGTYLVWDQAFRELVYEQDMLLDPCLPYERFVGFGTLSKAYGLPGLRVGWSVMPPRLIGPCVSLRDYSTYALSPLVERLAVHAVRGAGRLLAPRRDRARVNLAILDTWLKRHQETVDSARPVGGVTAFPRLAAVADVERFCRRLMAEHGVLLVPGACFGMPQHVRLGFGGPTHDLVEGLNRVSALLRAVLPDGAA